MVSLAPSLALLAVLAIAAWFAVPCHWIASAANPEFTGWIAPLSNGFRSGMVLYTDGAHSPLPPLPFVLLYAVGRGHAVWITESAFNMVERNLAKANLFTGFLVFGGTNAVITKNVSVGNFGYGLFVGLPGTAAASLTKNAAIGNTDAGVFVVSTGTAPSVVTVAQNTLYGNGVYPQSPPTNCGLVTQNQGTEILTVNAEGNYWGAESGPGTDPADAAGASCSAGAVTLNLTQWASGEIKVKAPVNRIFVAGSREARERHAASDRRSAASTSTSRSCRSTCRRR